MEITAYQREILVWLYGLQNYQGIFANVPPPPQGIVPPPISQAPGGEVWIAYGTVAADLATSPQAIQDIPGTAENDPQIAISAMPGYVTQLGGTLLLTLAGAQLVENLAREGYLPRIAEEALENLAARIAILDSAAQSDTACRPGGDSNPAPIPGSARWNTNAALLFREGLLSQQTSGTWRLTSTGREALAASQAQPSDRPL
ncbi:MAG TPA: hypothetical protein VFW40_00995 [Capsulimonadaceae bacterium]|nr:hypothetical protein [Capsulimonadaceae bacterium]